MESVCNVSAVNAIKTDVLRKATAEYVKTLMDENALAERTKQDVDALRRRQAPILYRISQGSMLKDAGFKSMTAYADTIGISDTSKSTISGLVALGKVLADKDAPDALKRMDVSKVAQMGTLIRDTDAYKQLKQDASKGALDGFTLDQVKTYVKSTKASTNPQVVTTYTATVNGKVHDHGADTLEGWKAFWSADTTVEYFPLPKGKVSHDADKATVNRAALVNGDNIKLVVYTSTTPDKPKDGKVKTTSGKDEFLKRAAAEGMPDEAINMALRAMGWDK